MEETPDSYYRRRVNRVATPLTPKTGPSVSGPVVESLLYLDLASPSQNPDPTKGPPDHPKFFDFGGFKHPAKYTPSPNGDDAPAPHSVPPLIDDFSSDSSPDYPDNLGLHRHGTTSSTQGPSPMLRQILGWPSELFDDTFKPKFEPSSNIQTPRLVGGAKDTPLACSNCFTLTTPLWRQGPQGEPLCNACGLFLKLHGVVRPLSLKTDVIKKRYRRSEMGLRAVGTLGRTKPIYSAKPAPVSGGVSPIMVKEQAEGSEPTVIPFDKTFVGINTITQDKARWSQEMKGSGNRFPYMPTKMSGITAPRDQPSDMHVRSICQDIYHHLLPHIARISRVGLSRILADLIRGLSASLRGIPLRPGLSMEGYVKACQRSIVDRIECLVNTANPAFPASRSSHDEMSLADKMSLWNRMDAERLPLDEEDQREDPPPYKPAELLALSEEIRAHDAYSRFMNFPQLLHTIVERMAQTVDDNVRDTDSPKLDSPSDNDSPSIEMLSLSSDSEEISRRNGSSTGLRVFRGLLRRMVIAFQSGSNLADDQSDAVPNIHTTISPSSAATQKSSDSYKQPSPNQRLRRKQEDNEDDHGHLGKKARKSAAGSCQRPRFLACPFWKADPVKHWDCFLKKITTISYVKQHLARRHTPDFYCQRCYKVFSDEQVYDRHVLDASCTRSAYTKLDGITPQQSKQLSRKCAGSVEEQWFAVWRIVFPGDTPPTSIYVDSDQSEDFCLIREFSQRSGATFLREELQAHGLLLRPGVSDEEVQDTLRAGLDSMFEYFRLNRDSVPTSSSPARTRRSSVQPMLQSTPADINSNSGIAAADTALSDVTQADSAPPWNNLSGSTSELSGTAATELELGEPPSPTRLPKFSAQLSATLPNQQNDSASDDAARGIVPAIVSLPDPGSEATDLESFGDNMFNFGEGVSGSEVPPGQFYDSMVDADGTMLGHGGPSDMDLEPVDLDMLIGKITKNEAGAREWEWLTMSL